MDEGAIRRCKFKSSKFIKSELTNLETEQITLDSCEFEEVSFSKSYIENSCFLDTEFRHMKTKGFCPIIEKSKISIKDSGSILFDGNFDFDKVLKFLTSA